MLKIRIKLKKSYISFKLLVFKYKKSISVVYIVYNEVIYNYYAAIIILSTAYFFRCI